MMNDLRIEQRQEDPVGKLSKEMYTLPQILVFGDVITLARGSGSGDSDVALNIMKSNCMIGE